MNSTELAYQNKKAKIDRMCSDVAAMINKDESLFKHAVSEAYANNSLIMARIIVQRLEELTGFTA